MRNTDTLVSTHNLNTLKWIDFLEIIKTEKHEILDVNYSVSNTYSEKQKESFKDAWAKLQDEAYLIEDNQEAKALLKKSFDRLMLVEKIRLLENDANLLIWLIDKQELYSYDGRLDDYDKAIQEIYAMIRNHDSRIKLNYFGEVSENIKSLERAILSLVNEYNTKHNDIEKKVDKHTKSIFYNVLQVNRVTGLQLNAMTMVVAEWFEAKKIAVEISNKQANKNNNE